MQLRKAASAAFATALAGAAMVGLAGTANAYPVCPGNYTFVIEDGVRVHTAPDINSPVAGIYYEPQYSSIDIIGDPNAKPFINLTIKDSGVTGFVSSGTGLAGCAAGTGYSS